MFGDRNEDIRLHLRDLRRNSKKNALLPTGYRGNLLDGDLEPEHLPDRRDGKNRPA